MGGTASSRGTFLMSFKEVGSITSNMGGSLGPPFSIATRRGAAKEEEERERRRRRESATKSWA